MQEMDTPRRDGENFSTEKDGGRVREDSPKLSGANEGGLERGTATLSTNVWTKEKVETPFKGLPPLPEAFKGGHLSQDPRPGMVEDTKPLEAKHSTLQEKISWVRREMLCLQRNDVALFNQLYILTLEIQDLTELSQEMEVFSKEQLVAESQPRDAGQSQSTAAFELTI